MFCPNCGEEIKNPNQRFCHKCGSEISTISEAPISQSPPGYTDFPISQQTQVKEGRAGPHSKKCLGFSIPSIALAIVLLAISGLLRLFYFVGMPLSLYIIGMIIVIIIHIGGLTLGVLSRKSSEKARKLEPKNAVEQVGSVFSIFGIIGNAILLIIALIVVIIASV